MNWLLQLIERLSFNTFERTVFGTEHDLHLVKKEGRERLLRRNGKKTVEGEREREKRKKVGKRKGKKQHLSDL